MNSNTPVPSPAFAECVFCGKTYFVGDSVQCQTCGDFFCGECISDEMECPHCNSYHDDDDEPAEDGE